MYLPIAPSAIGSASNSSSTNSRPTSGSNTNASSSISSNWVEIKIYDKESKIFLTLMGLVLKLKKKQSFTALLRQITGTSVHGFLEIYLRYRPFSTKNSSFWRFLAKYWPF